MVTLPYSLGQGRSFLDLVIHRPLEPHAGSRIPEDETTAQSGGKDAQLSAVIPERETEAEGSFGDDTPALDSCPTTPRPWFTSFISRRRPHLGLPATNVIVPECSVSRSNPNLLSAQGFFLEPDQVVAHCHSQPRPQPLSQRRPIPRRIFSKPIHSARRTGFGVLSHHASATALAISLSPHDSPPPCAYPAHAKTTTSLLTARETHAGNNTELSDPMSLTETLRVLTATVDGPPRMRLEDVMFVDESLLNDIDAATVKTTSTSQCAPTLCRSDSHSGTTEPFTPASHTVSLEALRIPPSEAAATHTLPENVPLGLASTVAGNDEGAATAREIMIAAEQNFAHYDAGRRCQLLPRTWPLDECPSFLEWPTLGFTNEVWYKFSNSYVKSRSSPAHFTCNNCTSPGQSGSVSEAGGDDEVEELVAECEASTVVDKAIHVKVGVVAKLSDLAAPDQLPPDQRRKVRRRK